MTTAEELLHRYDDQLRTDAETPGAVAVTRHGPLRLVRFGSGGAGGRGFVTYRDLAGADEAAVVDLVRAAVEHFRDETEVGRVEWKTRGHDHAPGLHEALLAHGFAPDDPESVMIGEAAALAAGLAEAPGRSLPDGVELRRITAEADVRAMVAMQDEVFGHPDSGFAESVLRALERDPDIELWVAEHDGTVVSAGRVEPVAGTDFAGIWGGATLPPWRGRGIYRALTATRARSALAKGCTLVHSDSTEHSRPILERAGLVRVTTTTPYHWKRRGREDEAREVGLRTGS